MSQPVVINSRRTLNIRPLARRKATVPTVLARTVDDPLDTTGLVDLDALHRELIRMKADRTADNK